MSRRAKIAIKESRSRRGAKTLKDRIDRLDSSLNSEKVPKPIGRAADAGNGSADNGIVNVGRAKNPTAAIDRTGRAFAGNRRKTEGHAANAISATKNRATTITTSTKRTALNFRSITRTITASNAPKRRSGAREQRLKRLRMPTFYRGEAPL